MLWFAAHIIIYTECTDGPQKEYPVWEDVVLICSDSAEHAWEQAEKHGAERYENSELTWNERPARLVYAGVRRLMSISEADSDGPRRKFGAFQDGLEITFSTFVVPTKADVERLADGESVAIMYHPDASYGDPD